MVRRNRRHAWLDSLLHDEEAKRHYAKERAVLVATEAIRRLMDVDQISKATLAQRLGVSRAAVSRTLGAGTNLSMRRLGEYLWALGQEVIDLKTVDFGVGVLRQEEAPGVVAERH